MQISITRIQGADIIDEPVVMDHFFRIKIEIDGQEFNISGKDGALDIHSASGMRLLVELVAANWLRIREQR